MTIRHVVCPQFTRSSTYGVFVVTNSDLNKRAVRSFSLIFMYISWSVWVQPDTNTSVMYLNKVRVNFISPLVVFFRLQPLDLEEFKVPLFGPEHRPLKKKKKLKKKGGFTLATILQQCSLGVVGVCREKKKKKTDRRIWASAGTKEAKLRSSVSSNCPWSHFKFCL